MDNIWSLKNGNICFRFEERDYFEHPWIIITIAVLLASGVGIEYLLKGTLVFLAPNFLLFFFAFLWWMTIPMKRNEAYIEKTVHEIMDSIVAKDAAVGRTEVVKSQVHYDTRGTYAIITGRCFLVLLKNGEVWEYNIEYHKPTEYEDGYYECFVNHNISENEEHIRAINPRYWSIFVSKFKMSDKTKVWLMMLAIVVIGGFAFAFSFWLVNKLKWWSLLLIGGYLAIYIFTEWITNKFGGKVLHIIERIISVPFIIVYIMVWIVQPFITIVGTYFFVVLFAFGVPAVVLTFMSRVEWCIIKPETITFFVLALGSILCAHFYRATKWMIRQSPLRDWGNHRYEFFREELAVYLIHPSNVVFLLYFAYFVVLTLSGYMQIEKSAYLISETFDDAILKAFLVFIAFTNMRNKAKDTEIDAKKLLGRILGLFEHDKY